MNMIAWTFKTGSRYRKLLALKITPCKCDIRGLACSPTRARFLPLPSCLVVPFSVAVGRRPRIHPVNSRPTAACVRPRFACRCQIFGECPLARPKTVTDSRDLSLQLGIFLHLWPRPWSLFGPTDEGVQIPEKVLLLHWGQITPDFEA